MATVETPPPVAGGADDYGPQGRSEWMDIDWREHQRWVAIDGRQVNLVEIGAGDPLLWVHGHSGCWQNWLENLPHFARTHRCIAVDLPGFGHSEMPRDPISIEGYGRFLDSFCDALDITGAPVIGNSMGGFVACELALKAPPRVERLVLVSAAGLSTKYVGLPNEIQRRRSVVALARLINTYARVPEARVETLMRRPRLRRLALEMVMAHPHRMPGPLCAEFLAGSGRPAAPDAMKAIVDYDYRERLDDVAAPTLIVWGERDRVVPVKSAHLYEELIPNARKVILEDTGHVPMAERPAAFNALVEEFLAEPVSDAD
ncbi:MAG: alpha/beta fold hydrolase [Solirubrobacteraceae bacterium]